MKCGESDTHRNPLAGIAAAVLAVLLTATPAGSQDVMMTSIVPGVLAPGQAATLVIEGDGFMPGCEVSFQPPSISTEDVRVLRPGEMEVDVVVSPSAAPGDVTVLYTFQGISESFDGLLKIEGAPQITDISPNQLYGPQESQQLTAHGQYFNADWVESLDVTALIISGSSSHQINEITSFIDASTIEIDLDTPEEYYADPCTIALSISDPLTGMQYSYDIPVEVARQTEPVIDSITFEADNALKLGTYPLPVTGSLAVEGSGLGTIDPASLQISGNKVSHLVLPAGEAPQLTSIKVSDNEITADVKFNVAGDDRSFADEGDGSAVLHAGDLTEPFSYVLDLEWPAPQIKGMDIEVDGAITGTESGGQITLSGDEVTISASITGDYLRELPGTSLTLSSNSCAFDYDTSITFSPDSTSAQADISLTPTDLPAAVPEAPFDLELSLGDSTFLKGFLIPVELTQVVPQLELNLAEFIPAEPLKEPGTDECQLHLEFTGENLNLLKFDIESFSLESDEHMKGLILLREEYAYINPDKASLGLAVRVSPPDVTDTTLNSDPALDETIVKYPVKVRYEEYSSAFDATFFASGDAELLLAYPPTFESMELAGDPSDLGGGSFSVPVEFTGTNLLAKYFEGAQGSVSSTESSAGPIALTSLEVTGGSSEAVEGIATFSLASLLEKDPTPRDQSFDLTVTELHSRSQLTSGEFTVHLGFAPVFSGLTVTSPGAGEQVGAEFDIQFVVEGSNLAPQYLDGAEASLSIVDPPMSSQFDLGPVEINSSASTSLQAVCTVEALRFDAMEPVSAELTVVPAVQGASPLRGRFMLDMVLLPVAQSLVASVDEPLALPDETEFTVEFHIVGMHFRPEYFEDLSFALAPSSPLPGNPVVTSGEPTLNELTPSSASGTLLCTLENGAALTSDELPLRCSATASRLDLPETTLVLPLEITPPTELPELHFSVPSPARITRQGGEATLVLPLSSSSVPRMDVPVHAEVLLPTGDSLGFDFQLSAGRRFSDSFELDASSLFDSLMSSKGSAGIAEGINPLSIEFSSPELEDFSASTDRVPCEVVAPLQINSVEVTDVQPEVLSLDDPEGLELQIAVEGDNLDTAAMTAYTRFKADGTPVRCVMNIRSASPGLLELDLQLGSEDVLELVGGLDPDQEEVEAGLQLSGIGIGGEEARGTSAYILGLPEVTASTGLALFVDDAQQLYTRCRAGAADDAPVDVQVELNLQFLSGEERVRNVRGLRFDRDTAEDAFVLQVGDEDYTPTDLRRRTENLLALEFELPQDAFETTGATPATLVLEPEDLVFAFEPILDSEQRTLEFETRLYWNAGGAGTSGNDVEPGSGGNGAEGGETEVEHRTVEFMASASSDRSYGVDNIVLDFAIPLSAQTGPWRDQLGNLTFSVLTAELFPGTAVLDSGQPQYSLDPATGEVTFGNGEQGARLPAGDFESGDIPEMRVGLGRSGFPSVRFIPLFNEDADPQLAVGVATSNELYWPGGWQVAGDPAVLRLEPWTTAPTTPEHSPVPNEDVQFGFDFELISPPPDDGFVNGNLLFAQFDWMLLSNVRLTQLGGWTFQLDRTAKSDGLMPVLVQDSNALPEGSVVPLRTDAAGAGDNENWDFSGAHTLRGPVLLDGQVVGEYALELDLDGHATLTSDLSGLERGVEYDLGEPEASGAEHPDDEAEGEGTPFGFGEEGGTDPFEELLDAIRSGIAVGFGWPWVFIPDPEDVEVDCSAAIDELRRLEDEEQCDCTDEEEALNKAMDAYYAALDAWGAAADAADGANQAKEDADKAKEEADQAVEDAEQAEKDAQAELERYINEEVPGASAVSGSASEAGAHGYGAQHAGAFACGNNFVGTRVGDSAAWDAHSAGINERWNAWKKAYHAAKKAREEAKAAADAAEQAAADAEQAQADLDAAEAALEEAETAFDEAYAAWQACKDACAEQDEALAAARAKVEECRAAGGMPGNEGGTGTESGGTGEGESGTSTAPGEGEGGDTGAGGEEGGESGEGSGGTSGGTSGGPSGGGSGAQPGGGTPGGGGTGAGPGGSQGGEDVRPPGGWPWEQPPPTSTGDEDLDELIKMFEELAKLLKQWEDVRGELEDNDMVKEVRLYQSIGDLLDNLGTLDSDVANALEEFVSCNSQPLEDLLAQGGDKIDAVIAALGLLKGAIGIYLIIDDNMPASRKAALEKIKAKLDKACDALEALKDKADNAAELASTLAAIKEGNIWPDDIIAWLQDKLSGMLSDAASELADKIIEKAVEKVVGSKAAGPIISIIKDLCDAGDAIGTKLKLDDLDDAITKALQEAIAKADGMEQYHIPCEWEYLSGKYIWIVGSPEDWANTEVTFKWEKHCLCSDGKWKTVTCTAGEPTVEDKDGRRYWTFPRVDLPKTECNPCYITVEVTIKRGSTTVSYNLLVGVQVCK